MRKVMRELILKARKQVKKKVSTKTNIKNQN